MVFTIQTLFNIVIDQVRAFFATNNPESATCVLIVGHLDLNSEIWALPVGVGAHGRVSRFPWQQIAGQ